MAATALDIYKAQALVLVPVVRELTAKLGEKEAHKLIRTAIGDHFRRFGDQVFSAIPGEDFGSRVTGLMELFAEGGALDWTIEEKSQDELKFRVEGCRYAEFYNEIGAPELGFLLVCEQDYPFNEGMGEGAVLERTQTIMQGSSHCQFHWYWQADKEKADAARLEETRKNVPETP
jgi:hypothetical protein